MGQIGTKLKIGEGSMANPNLHPFSAATDLLDTRLSNSNVAKGQKLKIGGGTAYRTSLIRGPGRPGQRVS